MSLPNKIDIINGQWQRAYEHFRQRLKERYKMDIAFHEYVLLTGEKLINKQNQSDRKSIGYLFIKGKKVLVAKDKRRKPLISTALQFKILTSKCDKIEIKTDYPGPLGV